MTVVEVDEDEDEEETVREVKEPVEESSENTSSSSWPRATERKERVNPRSAKNFIGARFSRGWPEWRGIKGGVQTRDALDSPGC